MTDSISENVNANVTMDPAGEFNLGNCTQYPALKTFDAFYQPIHAYLSLSICMFGNFTNILNAIILTHRMMRSPTNMLLTTIAIADSVTMTAYMIKDVYLHFITSPNPDGAPHGQAEIYMILATNFFAIGGHIVATVITVMLAVFRCWILYQPQRTITYGHIKRTVIVGVLVSTFISILGVSSFKVVRLDSPNNRTISSEHWWFEVRNGSETLDSATFAIYGCFIKLASCFLIALFTGLILAAMDRARRRYLKLKHANQQVSGVNEQLIAQKRDNTSAQSRSNQRTTIMLMAVVVSFVITEAPQGVINTLVTFEGNCFLFLVYVPIGDFLDLLVLLNSSTNFILYCAMSAQFRESFKLLIPKPFTFGCF